MINYEALFKISYGLFIVSSGDKNRGNGFISNTVFQVTSEPPKFAICCNKKNYTAEFITNSKAFSVSVLHTAASPDIFGRFGYKSGKDFNKLEGLNVRYGESTGVPVVLNESIAFLECRLVQTVDVGTHLIFIGELLNSEILDDSKDPITYMYYRQVRKGVAPKNAPTYIDKSKLEPKGKRPAFKKYECTACGYIYDEAIEGKKFIDLPPDWVCPSCGTAKEDFIEVIN
jgi:flavin reductase (DIM6/NTAB) family NADH-FMN oxidoreductase RutF/rubredoxin